MLEHVRRIFRDTYCQMCIDLDASKLSAIAKTMGHATTRTTGRTRTYKRKRRAQ